MLFTVAGVGWIFSDADLMKIDDNHGLLSFTTIFNSTTIINHRLSSQRGLASEVKYFPLRYELLTTFIFFLSLRKITPRRKKNILAQNEPFDETSESLVNGRLDVNNTQHSLMMMTILLSFLCTNTRTEPRLLWLISESRNVIGVRRKWRDNWIGKQVKVQQERECSLPARRWWKTWKKLCLVVALPSSW